MRGGRRRGGALACPYGCLSSPSSFFTLSSVVDHCCGHPLSLPCHVIVVHLSSSSSRVVNAKGGRGQGDVAVVGRCYKGC